MGKDAEYLVIGQFKFADDVERAIVKLQELGHGDAIELFSPVPNHDLEDRIYKERPRSPVRRVTLTGGLLGCLGAFLMTCWMSIDYPLRVSAKPLLSYPSFIIIAFECTILIGAISTLLAMFHFSRIPDIFKNHGFRPNFTNGTFGLTVRAPKDKMNSLETDFKNFGAEKIETQYVR